MSTDRRILCVGLCVIDFVHICDKYPAEDSDKRSLGGHWQRGGNASNNCTVLRNLGADCEFLGVVSNSSAFRFLRDDFNKHGIAIKNCPLVDQDPIFSSIILSQATKSRTIICTNQNFPILRYDDFKKVKLDEYKWIHFEARNPQETGRMIEDIMRFNLRAERPIRTSLELEKPREGDLVLTKYMDYIFFGKDFANYLGWNDIKSAIYGLKDRIENKNCSLICTWGCNGSAIMWPSGEVAFINPYPPDSIVDSLGAGDTFCASVIFALNSGKTLYQAVDFGSKVAGFKLSFYGYDKVRDFNAF